jgi:hypothetical protein
MPADAPEHEKALPGNRTAPSTTLIRFLWVIGAALLLIFTWTSPAFRDAEGAFTGGVALPISAAVACAIQAWAWGQTNWRVSGAWAGILLLGQAATLQLIDAGKLIHYQHYRQSLAVDHPEALIILLAELLAVMSALPRHLAGLHRWWKRNFTLLATVFIAGFFFLSSASLSRNPLDYLGEFLWAGLLQALHLMAIFLGAQSLPGSAASACQHWTDRLLCPENGSERPGWRDPLVRNLAIGVVCVSGFLSYFVYQNHPHIPDEVMYVFHAKYLAAGKLSLSPPPVPEAFDVYLMELANGKWFSSPPPAWSMVLAIGMWLGAPWMVNPVLGGLNVLLAYAFLRAVFDLRTARIGVILLATSPWIVLMSINFMMHTLTLTCALVAANGVIRCRQTGGSRWALIAGLATGYASFIRPLDGLVLAVLLGIWALGFGGKRLSFGAILCLGLGTAITGSLALGYNYHLTGNPFHFPLATYLDKKFGPGKNDLGFGANRGLPFGQLDPWPGYLPQEALVNAALNVFQLNIELLGWACGSLLIILLLVFSRKLERPDRLMIAVILFVIGAFSLYWYSGGPDFGARYWYLISVPLIALAARGIQSLEHSVPEPHRWRVLVPVLLLSGMTLTTYIPWRAADKYYHYLLMRPDLNTVANNPEFRNSVIFIRGTSSHPDYASAWFYNPLRWDTDAPVFVSLDRPELKSAITKAYPDRTYWVFEGPTLTKGPYRNLGRVTAQELLATDYQSLPQPDPK